MTNHDVSWYDPIKAAWNTAATYENYEDAQEAVTRLASEEFPIEHIDIVGSDLRLVERVTGPMTRRRAATRGALNGAGLGALLGLVLGLFAPFPAWLAMAVIAALIGVIWGGAFGFAGHSVINGARGFAATRKIVAARYDLVVRGGYVDRVREILSRPATPST